MIAAIRTKRQLASVFRRAAMVIESQPILSKGTSIRIFDETPCHCAGSAFGLALGAYHHVTSPMVGRYVNFGDLNSHIAEHAAGLFSKAVMPNGDHLHPAFGMASWNDLESTTKNRVVQVFRAIAYALEHGGRFPKTFVPG